MATTKLINRQSLKGNKGYTRVEWHSSSLLHTAVEQRSRFFFMDGWTRLNVERKLESWNILVFAFAIIMLFFLKIC